MTHRTLIVILGLACLAGCSTLDLGLRRAGPGSWTTEGDSPARRNAIEAALQPPLKEAYRSDAGAGFGDLSPLIVDEAVLVANRKGEVHAFDLRTGRRLGQATFGESIEGTPLFHEGMLYVPVAWGRSALLAYDLRSGEKKWRVKGSKISAGLVLFGENVIAADESGHVTAYEGKSGNVVWTVDFGPGAAFKATPALAGDVLFAADDAGHLAALRGADGTLVWSFDVGAPIYETLAADERRVYAATTRGRFVAIDAVTGKPQWSFEAGNDEVHLSAPAVGSGSVIFGASDAKVRALDLEHGNVLWTAEAEAVVAATPLITKNAVYVGTMRSRLLALERDTGRLLWETKLDGRMKSAFAAKDGRLVVLAEPRTVYVFESEVDSYATSEE